MAAIEGLHALKEPCVVHIFSDSRYLVDAFQKRWLKEWELRGWRKADGKPVKNDDLWKRLRTLTEGHEVVFHHVSGHSGQEYNERCDRLAVSTAESFSKKQGT